MSKAFVYGMSVEGDNFTDRVKETERLALNFQNGINTILISPRRMGKTSLVKKVLSTLADHSDILPVYLDIYDCRNDYDFYNKLAAAVIRQTSGRMEQWLEDARDFLARLSPKVSFSMDPNNEYSLSLGITPATHTPEEVLALPETIARKRGKSVVVCIDEFQQIGEMNDSLTIQKRLRGAWQHQQHCTYCLFGSKKHMMIRLFQDKRMPFYQFGEMMMLSRIPTADWVAYIQQRFESRGKHIDTPYAERICAVTANHSSYVQQLAWNVFAETTDTVTDEAMQNGISSLVAQCSALFQQQIAGMGHYQLNMLRAIKAGVHESFGSRQVMAQYDLGSKSNITRLQTALIEKEVIESTPDGLQFADPIFPLWFGQ